MYKSIMQKDFLEKELGIINKEMRTAEPYRKFYLMGQKKIIKKMLFEITFDEKHGKKDEVRYMKSYSIVG